MRGSRHHHIPRNIENHRMPIGLTCPRKSCGSVAMEDVPDCRVDISYLACSQGGEAAEDPVCKGSTIFGLCNLRHGKCREYRGGAIAMMW